MEAHRPFFFSFPSFPVLFASSSSLPGRFARSCGVARSPWLPSLPFPSHPSGLRLPLPMGFSHWGVWGLVGTAGTRAFAPVGNVVRWGLCRGGAVHWLSGSRDLI
uniref:Uncharacterized protein n=1 Tax=Trypanosoma congolense (strain IL3000) TaxID=1068625 RepID=G0URD7_TRYCI|nr:hypothetical protein, unlikely [Trypanosoma congolense IL3000]